MHHDAAASSSTDLTMEDTVARYEAILSSTLDPIVIIDIHGIIHSVSDSIERVFGYTPDELIGRNVNVLMPEPHRSMHDTYLARYQETGETHILGRTREFEVVKKDGTLFPIELSVSRVDVPGQNEPLFTGIVHDLSERKRAEEELALVQRLALGISSASDLDTALVVALREICDKTGWDFGEAWLPTRDGQALIGGPYWHQPNDEYASFRRDTRGTRFQRGEGLPGRVLASRRPEWLTRLASPEQETFLRSETAQKAGLQAGFAIPILSGEAVVAVIAFFAKTRREADDRLLNLVSTATAPLGPVIHRRRAEDALIESERRFREMLNTVNLLAVMLDRNGRIMFCGDFLLETTGYTREHIIGQDWFEQFIPEEERENVLDMFRAGLSRGDIQPQFENHILTRNGEKRLIAWSNTVMHGSAGQIIGAFSLGVDVTEKRQVEAELERHRHHLEQLVAERTADLEATHEQLRMADRLASIGTLTAGLGHDMNNMLLSMRCRLDAMQSMDLPEAQREQIPPLQNSVDYLQQLTDGLLLFALDPEDGEASSATTDVNAWWWQVGSLLSRTVPKSVDFKASIFDPLPPLAVPSHRLTQAVLNLIVNAGEAVEDGGRVHLRIGIAEDGRFVRLRVIDNGCGMPEDVRQRVLEPFFTRKKRGLGTGLGLSLVRGVVQSAGGSIKIDSVPGRGTVMTLLLPSADAWRPLPSCDGPATVTASVTISDARVATFLAVLLQGAGAEVIPSPSSGPPSTDIWLVESDVARPTDIRSYLESADRRLILYPTTDDKAAVDAPRRELPEANVIVIHEPENFEAIRRLISEVVDQLAQSNIASETGT